MEVPLPCLAFYESVSNRILTASRVRSDRGQVDSPLGINVVTATHLVSEIRAGIAHFVLHLGVKWEAERLIGNVKHEVVVDMGVGEVEEAITPRRIVHFPLVHSVARPELVAVDGVDVG